LKPANVLTFFDIDLFWKFKALLTNLGALNPKSKASKAFRRNYSTVEMSYFYTKIAYTHRYTLLEQFTFSSILLELNSIWYIKYKIKIYKYTRYYSHGPCPCPAHANTNKQRNF
jgi:hypothetical protein